MAVSDLPQRVGALTNDGMKNILDLAKNDDAFRAELATQLALDPRGAIKQVFDLKDDEVDAIDSVHDAVLEKYVHFAIAQLASPHYKDFDVYWTPGINCPVAVEVHWTSPFGNFPMVLKLNLCEVDTSAPKSNLIARLAAQL